MRANERNQDQLRQINFHRNYTKHADGSVLVEFGDTHVLCSAFCNEGVPRFLKGSKQGWLTAEYSMLPSATHSRSQREAKKGQQSGRTQEIQRLIGRSLRHAVDLKAVGEYTIMIDCDVIQADGGTRTAAITGSCIALYDALTKLQQKNDLSTLPMNHLIASVSVGMVDNQVLLDLNYEEDFAADIDMNVVMTEDGKFIEIQGTAEGHAFSNDQLQKMTDCAQKGIMQLIDLQKQILAI